MNTALRRQARRAYWLGRLREARVELGVALLWAVTAALAAQDASMVLYPAIWLLLLTSLFMMYGRGVGRSVLPGLLLGFVPLSCALLAQHWGHLCIDGGCTSLCVPICTGGGIVAGLVLARAARSTSSPLVVWMSAGALVLSAGALGCACVGAGGVTGMTLGFLASGGFLMWPKKTTTKKLS